jgi:hypothetical protein
MSDLRDVFVEAFGEEILSGTNAQYIASSIRREILSIIKEREELAAVEETPEPPAPPAFAVGDRVRVLVDDALVKEGDEGEIKGKSYVGGKIVWDVKVDGLAGMCEFEPHELEPLSEPAPMGAPALPEGVTLPPAPLSMSCDESEYGSVTFMEHQIGVLSITMDNNGLESNVTLAPSKLRMIHEYTGAMLARWEVPNGR